jgi:N-methylhydantoinase A/oxoprolinase/acetone carboxylase beta subunit
MLRVGVDIGGTHTDLVMIDEARGAITAHKIPTTVADPSAGTVEALVELCGMADADIAAIDYFMHGTTVATNIALEHNGAKTGLITTAGFRDILHIARHKRPQTFSLQLDLPWQTHPLVPRRRRIGVKERIVPPGDVLVPLDEAAARAAVRKLVAEGVEAIAVCFLFSFLNPAHERRVGEIIAEEAPGVFVSLSHEVVPQYREYERFSTTALNAYVGPKTAVYLGRLADHLADKGVKAGLHLMQSSGGAATHDGAAKRPVMLLMSGPAGGLLGGIWVGKSAGFDSVVTLDVGGTSADIGVAPDGEVLYKHILDTRLGDYHAMVPMAEIDSIGAGGGSIAYIGAGGQFQVGPRSAGSEPGPCCYGRGGSEPTATDCLVTLGRIDPASFLGGRLPLRIELATAAIAEKLAKPLDQSVEEAALGAIKILTHNMVQAIEINSVRRGYDPRDFALVAFGGGGPLFACEIARELGIPAVVIPTAPGLTSALGLLTTDVAYEQSRTTMQFVSTADIARLAATYVELEADLRDQLAADGFKDNDIRLVRLADCRYRGQGYELRTLAPSGAIDRDFLERLARAFGVEHRRIYNHEYADRDVQIVNVRVVGTGAIPPLVPRPVEQGTEVPDTAARISVTPVVFEVGGAARSLDTPRYSRTALKAGNRLDGPAIVDQMDTTTMIPPGFRARVDGFGNLVITQVGTTQS